MYDSLIETYSRDEFKEHHGEEIVKYITNLRFKKTLLDVATLNYRGLNRVLHPFRLIRTNEELDRLEGITKDLYKFHKQNLMETVVEESGDLEEDLNNSYTKFRPSIIKSYMDRNPIYNEEIDKKLIKIGK